MALIGAVYKWRLDCDSYVYITDTNGTDPLIITAKCLEEKSEQSIQNIVTTWDERTYCERFNEMVNYVHSFEKWKDLHFLDCNVYLKEYYGCEEMLKPSFPTGILCSWKNSFRSKNDDTEPGGSPLAEVHRSNVSISLGSVPGSQ